MDDLQDFIDEHKLSLIMLGLIGIAAYSWVTGGKEMMDKKNAVESAKAEAAAMQSNAEQVFAEQGCAAQFLNAATGKTGLTEGAIAIDPATNTPFSGGYLCAADGGVYQVLEGGRVHHVGTSPKVRNAMISGNFQGRALEMLSEAQRNKLIKRGS